MKTWAVFSFGMAFACFVMFLGLLVKNNTLFFEGKYALSCEDVCISYKETRDMLSRELNAMKQVHGKLNCEMNEVLKKELVTNAGGWCKKDSSPGSFNHITDKPFGEALSKFFTGKRVGSFGDGPGAYKSILDETGLLLKYDAYDGAPYCEEVTNGVVKFLDLTAPQYGLPVYDWILSLEVAEHIPAKFESIYVDNLVRHANEGIVLSWALPHQGGHGHVNGKSFHDVKNLMTRSGFEWDEAASKELKSHATYQWLYLNVNVYRRSVKTFLSRKA